MTKLSNLKKQLEEAKIKASSIETELAKKMEILPKGKEAGHFQDKLKQQEKDAKSQAKHLT